MFPFGIMFYGLMNPSLISPSRMEKYVRHPMKYENNPLYTLKILKHGGGNTKV